MEFDLVDEAAVRAGRATDAYFERTEDALAAAGRDPTVVAEVTADQFPDGSFELLAGVRDAAALLAGLPVDADAVRPGRLFDGGPVLRVEGPYRSFARFETALLGFLSHASGIATAALDCRRAAPESTLLSFGARHVHPSMAATVERSALTAGFDGFSSVAAGDLLGREASGTMPHALALCFGRGEQEAAWRAFDEGSPPETPRVALVDTFDDEVAETRRELDARRTGPRGRRRRLLRRAGPCGPPAAPGRRRRVRRRRLRLERRPGRVRAGHRLGGRRGGREAREAAGRKGGLPDADRRPPRRAPRDRGPERRGGAVRAAGS